MRDATLPCGVGRCGKLPTEVEHIIEESAVSPHTCDIFVDYPMGVWYQPTLHKKRLLKEGEPNGTNHSRTRTSGW